MEVPPLLMSGKFCPVTGINSTATAILMMACSIIGIPNPKANSCPKRVAACWEITTNRNSKIK